MVVFSVCTWIKRLSEFLREFNSNKFNFQRLEYHTIVITKLFKPNFFGENYPTQIIYVAPEETMKPV